MISYSNGPSQMDEGVAVLQIVCLASASFNVHETGSPHELLVAANSRFTGPSESAEACVYPITRRKNWFDKCITAAQPLYSEDEALPACTTRQASLERYIIGALKQTSLRTFRIFFSGFHNSHQLSKGLLTVSFITQRLSGWALMGFRDYIAAYNTTDLINVA